MKDFCVGYGRAVTPEVGSFNIFNFVLRYLITKDTTSVSQENSAGITVRQLFELCKQEINRGNGNKVILISEDDELNGFHTLWEGFTSDPHTIMMYSADDMFHNDNDPSTVILLS